jgi:hypothetical protein
MAYLVLILILSAVVAVAMHRLLLGGTVGSDKRPEHFVDDKDERGLERRHRQSIASDVSRTRKSGRGAPGPQDLSSPAERLQPLRSPPMVPKDPPQGTGEGST